jgi:hypothetical protein
MYYTGHGKTFGSSNISVVTSYSKLNKIVLFFMI